MEKTKVIFQNWNPNSDGVKSVAIQTDNNPPYVWRCYHTNDSLPIILGDDIVILPIKAARRLFEFEKGKLADINS